jgi:transposase InsO family protein
VRYQFIQEHTSEFGVQEMCRVLGLSRSGYYAWLDRPASQHTQRDATLSDQIRLLYHESSARYGSPRIHRELQVQGIHCGQKRVARLMQEQQLSACQPRRFMATTDSAHGSPTAPNVLDRQYQVEAVPRLNQVWAGDITYIPTAGGWLYLAVVLDLKSRRVIGWGMSHTLEQSVVHHALEMALGQRARHEDDAGLLFHSDRGSQYAAGAYQERLREQGITGSMSRRGGCPLGGLGQRTSGKLLCHAQEGVGAPGEVPDQGASQSQRVPLHRGLLQPQTTTFSSGLLEPIRLRANLA